MFNLPQNEEITEKNLAEVNNELNRLREELKEIDGKLLMLDNEGLLSETMKDINYDEDDENNLIIDETIFGLKPNKENSREFVLEKKSISSNYYDDETIIFDEDDNFRMETENDKIIKDKTVLNSSDENEESLIIESDEEDHFIDKNEKEKVIENESFGNKNKLERKEEINDDDVKYEKQKEEENDDDNDILEESIFVNKFSKIDQSKTKSNISTIQEEDDEIDKNEE
ncbi:hypothetical protein SNEBB_002786, partial [Seison nebaliae]